MKSGDSFCSNPAHRMTDMYRYADRQTDRQTEGQTNQRDRITAALADVQ